MKPAESFVGQPIRSLQTMLSVISKYDESLPYIVPDGIYGQNTFTAVTTFQRRNGLPVTGVVNQQTWDTIAQQHQQALVFVSQGQPVSILVDPAVVWELGDQDAMILLAQSMLLHMSGKYNNIAVPPQNSILDAQTQDSLRSFQRLAGLEETGDLDRLTWKYLSLSYTLSTNL